MFRKHESAVDKHVEDPGGAFDKVRFDAVFALDCGRETRGPWEIVSNDAVDDLDVHGVLQRPRLGCAAGALETLCDSARRMSLP